MLIDSDVLIWYMKGNKKARKIVDEQPGFSMSVITYMELVQVLRNKEEWTEFQKAMKVWQTSELPINERISTKAQFYVDSYFLSHSIRLADALIAATAVEHNLELCTANNKHYKAIPELTLQVFRP